MHKLFVDMCILSLASEQEFEMSSGCVHSLMNVCWRLKGGASGPECLTPQAFAGPLLVSVLIICYGLQLLCLSHLRFPPCFVSKSSADLVE